MREQPSVLNPPMLDASEHPFATREYRLSVSNKPEEPFRIEAPKTASFAAT